MSGAENRPEPVDYLGAVALALEGSATIEGANAVIREIMKDAPEPPGSALWPTKLLVEAVQSLQGSWDVP